MRHGSSAGRRSRHRGQGGGGHNHNQGQNRHRSGGGGGGNRMQVFDSNGPEVRIRGTANQICEKYTALAKDAASQGNRVLSESYLQHAEHYQRIINTFVTEAPARFDNQAEHDASQDPAVVEQPRVTTASSASEEDLGLPASILGTARAPELTDA